MALSASRAVERAPEPLQPENAPSVLVWAPCIVPAQVWLGHITMHSRLYHLQSISEQINHTNGLGLIAQAHLLIMNGYTMDAQAERDLHVQRPKVLLPLRWRYSSHGSPPWRLMLHNLGCSWCPRE